MLEVRNLVLQIWKGFTDSNYMYDFDNRLIWLKNSVTMLSWFEKIPVFTENYVFLKYKMASWPIVTID